MKNDIDVVERNDLNIINKAFECLWVEIRNEKHKNIVCGCLYRHPNSDIDDSREYISKCLTKLNKEKKNVTYLVISILISLNMTLIINTQIFYDFFWVPTPHITTYQNKWF